MMDVWIDISLSKFSGGFNRGFWITISVPCLESKRKRLSDLAD
jgi:hypothetical protein